ncbi:hypothetical protein D3C71_958780 [compost metagenome]
MGFGFFQYFAVKVFGLGNSAFEGQAHAAHATAEQAASWRALQSLSAFEHFPGLFVVALVHVEPSQRIAASGVGEIVGIGGDRQQLGQCRQHRCRIVLLHGQAALQHGECMALLAVEFFVMGSQVLQRLLQGREIARIKLQVRHDHL